jgi:hypothetical protein
MEKRRLIAHLQLAILIAGAVLATVVSGCVHVAPYQRGRLAHQTMLLNELATPGEAHVYAIQEGAVGGGSAVEGGCGCN